MVTKLQLVAKKHRSLFRANRRGMEQTVAEKPHLAQKLVKQHHKLQALGLEVQVTEGGSPTQMLLCPTHSLQGALYLL